MQEREDITIPDHMYFKHYLLNRLKKVYSSALSTQNFLQNSPKNKIRGRVPQVPH